jgi:hypothetical protein
MEKRNIARLTQRLSTAANNLRRDTERYRAPNNMRTGRKYNINNYNPACIVSLEEICREKEININFNIVRDE